MVKYGRKKKSENDFHKKMEVSKMGNNLKVLLTGDGSEFGKNCANILRTYGCDVVLVPKDGKNVLSKINNDSIDVVVMDAFMANLDALGVINEINDENRPLIMIMSSTDNQRFEQEILSAGADYYFLKPFDINI